MSSPMGDTGPDRSFQSRVNRVADAHFPYEESRPGVSVLPDWKRDVAMKSGPLVAVVIGVLSVFLVRLGQFHYSGTALVSDTPLFTTAKEACAALLLSAMFVVILPYRGFIFIFCLLAAIGGTTVAMHNAVHKAPWLFSLMFSPGWTEEVTAATEPRSLYVLGDVIPIKGPGEKKKKMPTVLRLN